MSTGVWIVVVVLVMLMALGIVQALRKRELTDEEFEREARRPSLMRTGLQEFQGFLEPEKKAALEVVEQEKRKTDQSVAGEPPGRTR